MRVAIVGALCALVGVLGALQVLGSVAVRGSARAGAWVRFVPEGLAERVDRLDTMVPLPGALRLVLARHALARGELELAGREVARMGVSRDRLALQGRLAEARHEPTAAADAYLAADDFADVQAAVDARAGRRDFTGALALEASAIGRLRKDPTQADALAEAYFHLGLLQQSIAYTSALGTPQHRAGEQSAVTAYGQAVALAPLSLRYLIALGNQFLNLAQLSAAQRTFERARDIDPTSAEPLAGLADAALRRGDVNGARAFLTRARALDPTSPAVARLGRRAGM